MLERPPGVSRTARAAVSATVSLEQDRELSHPYAAVRAHRAPVRARDTRRRVAQMHERAGRDATGSLTSISMHIHIMALQIFWEQTG